MKPKPSADPYTVAQQALHDAQLALASIPRPPPPTPNPTPPSRVSTRAARCTSCEQLRAKLVSIEASAGAQKQQVGLLSAAIDRAKARERELRRECERLLARIGELEATPERALRVSDQRTVPREVQVEMLPVEFDDASNLVGSAWTSTAALSALASTSQRQEEEEEEEGHDHFRHYRRPTRKPERPRKRAKLAEEDEASSPLSSASVSTPNPNPKPAPTKRKPPLCAILAAARHPPQAPNRQRHGTAFGARLPALLVEDDAYLFELPGEVWGDDDDAAALGGGDAHEYEHEHRREAEGEAGGGGGADNGGGGEEEPEQPPQKKSHKKQPRKVPAYDYEHRRSRVVVPAPARVPAGDAVSTGESESPRKEQEKEKEEPHALETPGVFFTLKF